MSNVAIQNQQSMIPDHRLSQNSGTQKSYAGSSQSKALGSDPALASWYEQAYSYYSAVSSGEEPKPDEAAWNDFLQQMNWAYDQLQGSSWGGSDWGEVELWEPGMSASGGTNMDPYGGQMGTQGNLVHSDTLAEFGYVGGVTRDIWSNEINIRIPSLAADVQAMIVQDESVQPPESVLKIIVTDKATGQQDVYHIHDYEDAEVKVFTPTEEQLQDPSGLLTWEEFSNVTPVDMGDATNYPVELAEDGHYVVEAPMGETIELTPPLGELGAANEVWELWGDFNLNLRPSDQVTVYQGSKSDPDGYTIIIQQRNGKKITIHTHAGFKGNLNANPENVQWVEGPPGQIIAPMDPPLVFDPSLGNGTPSTPGNPATPDEDTFVGVPEAFQEDFTLNGDIGLEAEAEVEVNGDYPTSEANGERIWDGTNFDIYSRSDGKIGQVYARGEVTLHASSNLEYWKVSWDAANERYVVKVYDSANSDEGDLLETFYVDNMADKIIFDVDANHIEFAPPIGAAAGAHLPDADSPEGSKVSVVGEETQSASQLEWPSVEIQGSILPYIAGETYAQQLELMMSTAFQTDNWDEVKAQLLALQSNMAKGNDAVRVLVGAIYVAAGKDMDKFGEIMDLIPEDVRLQMISTVSANRSELNERRGAQWNSATTATKILATLDQE